MLTADVYAHVAPGLQAKAAEKLETLLYQRQAG
jgi:hypothetical protein